MLTFLFFSGSFPSPDIEENGGHFTGSFTEGKRFYHTLKVEDISLDHILESFLNLIFIASLVLQ